MCDSEERVAAPSELGSVDWGDTYFILYSVRLQIGTAQAFIYLRETWGTLSPRAGVIGKDTRS